MAAVVSSSFLLSSTTLDWSFSISPSPFTHLKHNQGTPMTAADVFAHRLVAKKISHHRFGVWMETSDRNVYRNSNVSSGSKWFKRKVNKQTNKNANKQPEY